MTTEQKAKAYDEALERAMKELQACGSTDCDAAKQIFRFFPELKESEEDRIRKEMIEIIGNEAKEFPSSIIASKANSWIAWLEKQGEHNKFREYNKI